MIESGIVAIEQARSGIVSAAAIETAERDLFAFYVTAYHLKDALINEQAAPKQVVENAVSSNSDLALLADLANLDKHHRLDPNKQPRSGNVPVFKGRQAASDPAGWRLNVTIEHNGRDLDGIKVARSAVDAWRTWLQAQGLL